jgi:hypothetical protein
MLPGAGLARRPDRARTRPESLSTVHRLWLEGVLRGDPRGLRAQRPTRRCQIDKAARIIEQQRKHVQAFLRKGLRQARQFGGTAARRHQRPREPDGGP